METIWTNGQSITVAFSGENSYALPDGSVQTVIGVRAITARPETRIRISNCSPTNGAEIEQKKRALELGLEVEIPDPIYHEPEFPSEDAIRRAGQEALQKIYWDPKSQGFKVPDGEYENEDGNLLTIKDGKAKVWLPEGIRAEVSVDGGYKHEFPWPLEGEAGRSELINEVPPAIVAVADGLAAVCRQNDVARMEARNAVERAQLAKELGLKT